jgi:hypothetical protein
LAIGGKPFYLVFEWKSVKDVVMLLCIFNTPMQTYVSISLLVAEPEMTGKQLDEHEYVFNLV